MNAYAIVFVCLVAIGSCELDPVCKLPLAPAAGEISCMAYFPRFYYNTASGKCEQFIYGGCRGNANNFQTLEACQEKCH